MFGKGLTFDFFSDTLVRQAILVTPQCVDSIITSSSTHGKDTVLPRRTTWTTKILTVTEDRLQSFYIWLCQSVPVFVVYPPFDAPHMLTCRGTCHDRTQFLREPYIVQEKTFS